MFPEAPISRETIDQHLKSEVAPQPQQLHPYRYFAETRLRVIPESAVVLPEIPEAEAVQMALVRGVAEGAEIRVMRRFQAHRPALPHQPVKLLHGADDVVHMLDDVDRRQPVERAVGERVRKAV